MKCNKTVEVMTEAVEELCGLENGQVANPWIVEHEREVNEMREEIEGLLRDKEGCEMSGGSEEQQQSE